MQIKNINDDLKSNQLARENLCSSISKGEWFGNKKNYFYDASENVEKVIDVRDVILII